MVWPPEARLPHDRSVSCFLRERPITRFVYWASHGVPMVSFAFSPYMDVARLAGLDYLLADSHEEAARLLGRLLESPELRVSTSRKLLDLARLFSTEYVAEVYGRKLAKIAGVV